MPYSAFCLELLQATSVRFLVHLWAAMCFSSVPYIPIPTPSLSCQVSLRFATPASRLVLHHHVLEPVQQVGWWRYRQEGCIKNFGFDTLQLLISAVDLCVEILILDRK